MSTTYEIGGVGSGVYLAKDMIFGWVVQQDGQNYLVSEMDKQSLEYLSKIRLFDRDVQNSLQEAVSASLKTLEESTANLYQKVEVKQKPLVEKPWEYDPVELKKSMDDIKSKLKTLGKDLYWLPWGLISKVGTGWRFQSVNMTGEFLADSFEETINKLAHRYY